MGSGQEIEVKFFMADLAAFEQRLLQAGAQLVQARQYERNLRFDTPEGRLKSQFKALRLRQDNAARLTYKGPPLSDRGARLRQELEFVVSDFDMAQQFLEALGFEVVVMYEKYRSTYALADTLVTLDEMPYGNFTEIEGPSGERIQAVAGLLGLDWSKRSLESYLVLFERLKAQYGWQFRDLSFENFAPMPPLEPAVWEQAAGVDES